MNMDRAKVRELAQAETEQTIPGSQDITSFSTHHKFSIRMAERAETCGRSLIIKVFVSLVRCII
jgi:hypothetical protein